MSGSAALVVNDQLTIPRGELGFRATRAGGPGGQHVNTSSTRVELVWNVENSRALSQHQRSLLTEKLASRLDAAGNLRVVASEYRSQARNRDDALLRLGAMIRRALVVPKPRKKTRPSRSSIESRLRTKQQTSRKKRDRQARDFD